MANKIASKWKTFEIHTKYIWKERQKERARNAIKITLKNAK